MPNGPNFPYSLPLEIKHHYNLLIKLRLDSHTSSSPFPFLTCPFSIRPAVTVDIP